MKLRAVLIAILAVIVTAYGLPKVETTRAAATSPTATYTYDSLGRLHTVKNAAGAVATYNYDAVGNLLSITNTAAATASPPAPLSRPTISDVTATPQDSGSRVVITGKHFDTLPLQNDVTIDGTSARVLASSPTRLTVYVPSATNARAVRVTTAAGSAVRGTMPRHRRSSPPTPMRRYTGTTGVTGRTLAIDGSPLAGVTISTDNQTITTNRDGYYTLQGLTVGHHTLVVDGGTVPGPKSYGLYEQGIDLVAGYTTTQLPNWLPALDTAHRVHIPSPTKTEVTVTNPSLPGVEVRVPAGTVITDHFGRAVTTLTLTPVPIDRTPVPLAPGMPTFFDLQPGDAYVSGPGLKIVYPNVTNQPPRTHVSYVTHDADALATGWRTYGTGTVTPDGTQITPDANASVYEIVPFGVTYQPGCTPNYCPPPGDNSNSGDPVNLSTGLFVMNKTDLTIPDVTPIAVTRTYRQMDDVLRSFGIGQNDVFDQGITPDNAGDFDLLLPDGGTIVFTPQLDGTYLANPTPTGYFGAVLTTTSEANFTITIKDGTVYTFGSESASLIGITDRFGNTTTLNRDTAGRVTQVTSPNGRWITVTWGTCATPSVCITQITDNIGRTINYSYDASGRLTSVIDPAGHPTSYTWSPCLDAVSCTELISIKDGRGITYLTNHYDTNARVDTQTQADGGTYHFLYGLDTNGRVTQTTVTDPRGVVRRVTFDSSGYTTADTEAVGSSIQQTTTYTRDATTHLVTRSTDALGRNTDFTYDTLGHTLSVTRLAATANAETTKYSYESSFGRLASVKDPLGNATTITYDDSNQTITSTDPLGLKTITTLSEGEPVAITDPLGHTTYLSYLNGDLVATADPLGRVTTRYTDSVGRTLRITDPLGNYTQYTYDSVDNVTSSTDPLGGITRSTYDANGNRLTLVDAGGNTTTYTYTNMDQVATRKDALGNTATYTYDKTGNPIRTTDRNGIADVYAYDQLGRQTFVGFHAVTSGTTTSYESTVSSTYDAGNRLRTLVDTTGGSLSFSYDLFDRPTGMTTPDGSITYTYDANGRRSTMAVAGQPTVAYSYDNDNRQTKITRGADTVQFAYDGASRRTQLTLPNGVVEHYAYDAASQLTALTYIAGTTSTGSIGYTYDANGRRTTVNGSLAAVNLPAAVSGNTYNADNELTSFGGTSLTYDKEGQLIKRGTTTYAWNARHQLIGIAGSVTDSFVYDALGRRRSKTVGGATTNLLYDGRNIVQEKAAGVATANLITGFATDETFSRTDSAGESSFLVDATGSTIGLSSPSDVTTSQYTYDPFGKATSTGTASSNTLKFTGREDDGTGLIFDRARYYDPTLQRFISQDPVGFLGGDTNLYAYAGNSPLNATDRSGESSIWGDVWSTLQTVAHDARKAFADAGIWLAANACALDPLSWSSETWHTIGEVTAVVGLVAGAAAICAATACIGGIAVAFGASSLTETLAAAATLSEVASAVGTVSLVVGTISDVGAGMKDCLGAARNETECAFDVGAIALDATTFGVGHYIDEYSLARPTFDTASGAASSAYSWATSQFRQQ